MTEPVENNAEDGHGISDLSFKKYKTGNPSEVFYAGPCNKTGCWFMETFEGLKLFGGPCESTGCYIATNPKHAPYIDEDSSSRNYEDYDENVKENEDDDYSYDDDGDEDFIIFPSSSRR